MAKPVFCTPIVYKADDCCQKTTINTAVGDYDSDNPLDGAVFPLNPTEGDIHLTKFQTELVIYRYQSNAWVVQAVIPINVLTKDPLPAYASDADALLDGLEAGDYYKLTAINDYFGFEDQIRQIA